MKIDRKLIKALENIMKKFEFETSEDIEYVKSIIEKFNSSNNSISITENGSLILSFMRMHPKEAMSAKEIAERIGYTSKSVAGSMRKLISDGLIIKISSNDGNKYQITEEGIKIKLKE